MKSRFSLLALAFGSFSIGMTEFTMMGILPDIAKELQVKIPEAAHLIAIYALGVVVGAPILVLFTSKFPPKKILIFLMGLFVVFNGLFALMPGMHLLLLTRFMAGLPHGAFFGVGSVVATTMAKKGREAQAIAIMFTGMTIANLAGVPLGTYIGHHYSWRYTYGIISALGLVTMVTIILWIPKIAPVISGNIFRQLKYFTTGTAWILIAMIAIGTGGLFAWMSYIAPLMTEIAGIKESDMPFVMVLVGLGMVIGNLLGGKLSDSLGAPQAAMSLFGLMVICLIVLFFTAHITWLAYTLSFVTGMAAFSVGPSLQYMLIKSSHGYETLAAAGGQASFNLGNTFGAFLGGLPLIYGYAYNFPLLIGAVMAFIGILFAFIFWKTRAHLLVSKL